MNKIIPSILLIILFSCGMKSENKTTITQPSKELTDPKVIKKNEEAIRLYTRCRDNNDSLQLALTYLEEAITIDSAYLLSYVNKAQIECQMGNAMVAVSTMNTVCIKKPNDRYYLVAKGFYEDIADRKRDAQHSYEQALAVYNQLIQEYPDSATLYLDKYFVLHFCVKDPLVLKDSIDYYKKKFSKNVFWREVDFDQLDKDKYLKSMINNH